MADNLPKQRLHKDNIRFSLKRMVGYDRAWPIHAWLMVRPRLFYTLITLLGRSRGGIVTKNTGLVIAGIGGCSNTYASDIVKMRYPDMHVASHLHIPVLAIQAARLNVPCLALVRHPVDAITSLTSRGGIEFSVGGLAWALRDYAYFYESILPYKDHYVVANFKDVVTDYRAVMQRLNTKFGTDFDIPANDSEAAQALVNKNKWRGENRRVSKEEIREYLHHPMHEELRLKAEAAYERFCVETATAT